MIYVTGDIHGGFDIHKLSSKELRSAGLRIKKDDYVIVCGDFGLVWDNKPEERYWRKWLDEKPWTTLFVDGNHENFELLNTYPVEEWHGGRIHRISEKTIHLMRGNVFSLEGASFFTFGGAASHDKEWRLPGLSWWPEELPSDEELRQANDVLAQCNNQVDYIISHCAPSLIQGRLNPTYKIDRLTEYFEYVRETVKFKRWYFGHYHEDVDFDDGFSCLLDRVLPLESDFRTL